MNLTLIVVVLVGWMAIVIGLFPLVGPRRAALVAILGGLVLLPRQGVSIGWLPFDKRTATGLALLLGMGLFDRETLRKARFRWPDLPMLAFALVPLIGLGTGVPGSEADVVDLFVQRSLGWVVPYLVGRLYCGDRQGVRSLAIALVISGLVNIPICIYEELAGPSYYLSGLVYRLDFQPGMVDRLGGFRPEGFFANGLELAAWMALTTVMAGWLWVGGAWRPSRIPSWVPAVALALTTLSCRGVYGYILMVLGLGTLVVTRAFRTRALLIVLLLLPAAYISARASGVWDGKILVQGARLLGREATVAFRLEAENEWIARVRSHSLNFGYGNYVWHSQGQRWPDGQWLQVLWNGGIVGLGTLMAALYLVPPVLGLAIDRARPVAWKDVSPAWGLTTVCLLHMTDSLHNNSQFPATALIGGSLTGLFVQLRTANARSPRAVRNWKQNPSGQVTLLILTVVILLLLEWLGHRPPS